MPKKIGNSEFCDSCSSLLIGGKCTNKRCPSMNNKSKRWVIWGLEMEFKEPVTFQTAKEHYRRLKKKPK